MGLGVVVDSAIMCIFGLSNTKGCSKLIASEYPRYEDIYTSAQTEEFNQGEEDWHPQDHLH